jgi:prepilin-type N-terminal cleavage/methylation domain-containing protein
MRASFEFRRKRSFERGFSLIEMIGVLTVLALLALALTPILIKQFDRLAGEKEVAQLKAFADSFRAGIRNATPKYIPDEKTWAQFIGANAGIQSDQVMNNERRIARVFLIDPQFSIPAIVAGVEVGTKLPYTNSPMGAYRMPLNPRIMIISSISGTLTNLTLSGGKRLVSRADLNASDFNNLWSMAEGGPLPGGWGAYKGKADDLKIQRIHLADMFLSATLNTDVFTAHGKYAIDGDGPYFAPDDPLTGNTNSFTGYYLESTTLDLYNRGDDGNPLLLQYREVLHRAKSFTFALGTWQGEKFIGKLIARPGPLEMQRVASLFLASQPNPCAARGGITPLTVYTAMDAFMTNYIEWARSGCQCQTYPSCAGSHPPAGNFGDVLGGQPTQVGSQHYLGNQTVGLICRQL